MVFTGETVCSINTVCEDRRPKPSVHDENDKTDPSDKLQHKMNLVSNYFTK
jgi:hypothetical protein